MFATIAITVAITSLLFVAVTFRKRYLDMKESCRALRSANSGLRRQLANDRDIENENRVRRAYQKGLWDGRETDMAYREILKKTRDSNYDDKTLSYLRQQKEESRK